MKVELEVGQWMKIRDILDEYLLANLDWIPTEDMLVAVETIEYR